MAYKGQISLIITTYNRPDALAVVLEACLAQHDQNFEIIIADDGSTDQTRQLVRSLAARAGRAVQHVWQPDCGFRAAAARNKGIACARGDYLVFLDGDCVPQRDFIARHRALAEVGWAVTGSRVLLNPALTAHVLAQRISLLEVGVGFWISQRFTGGINKVWPLLLKFPDGVLRCAKGWKGVKACNLAAWRADVDKINGFDERFIGWGHEDADFLVRLYEIGVRRKKGFWATEVFHLWHPPADKSAESEHRARVTRRIRSNP